MLLTLFFKGWPSQSSFLISPLSGHFTHCQLGEDDSGREAALCHFDTVAVLVEQFQHEQDLSAGAVCLLKYAGICPVALP